MSDAVCDRIARADLCRFLAACYYQPERDFTQEKLFESMARAAGQVEGPLADLATRLGQACAAASLDQLLVDYTRLFLGPMRILAKPYGSFWLTGEHALMQDATLAVLALYGEGGFELDESFRELPDHVAAELEFLYLLLFRAAAAHQRYADDERATIERLRERFLAEHLGRWVAPFTAAVRDGAQTDFYRTLAELTAKVVAREARLA